MTLRRILPWLLTLLLPAWSLAATGSGGDSPPPPLDIAIRSAVQREYQGLFGGLAPPTQYRKSYVILSITEIPSAQPLVRPVDLNAFKKLLVAELAKEGFQETPPEQRPGMMITVLYGRGYLRNPYQKGMPAGSAENQGLFILSGLDAINQLANERSITFQQNLYNAGQEKLFVIISAWNFPDELTTKGGKVKKPERLWHTIAMINRPDVRDFNEFIGPMLTAAGGYFGRDTKDEEAFVTTTPPAGSVHIGETTVVPDKPAAATAAPKP